MSRVYDWKINIDDNELEEICSFLEKGELVVFPTETVYGIGADAFNGQACKKIFEAKGRPSDNPLIVHISDLDMLMDCVKNINYVEKKLIDAFMPGPFTLILEKKNSIPNEVTAGLDTVAIRMPNNKIANKIIKKFGKPIAAPSANKSGKPSGTKIEDIKEELDSSVYAFIDGGDTEIGLESTVVRVIDKIPVILRPGAITKEDILNVIGAVNVDKHVLNNVEKDEKVLSPGMKHKHYAPKTRCVLLDIKDSQEKKDISEQLKNENVIVLGLEKDKSNYSQISFESIGKNLEEFSKNIFTKLRKIDEEGYNLILIESVSVDGIGLAIMNRIIRTCGYNIINNKNQVADYIENR